MGPPAIRLAALSLWREAGQSQQVNIEEAHMKENSTAKATKKKGRGGGC